MHRVTFDLGAFEVRLTHQRRSDEHCTLPVPLDPETQTYDQQTAVADYAAADGSSPECQAGKQGASCTVHVRQAMPPFAPVQCTLSLTHVALQPPASQPVKTGGYARSTAPTVDIVDVMLPAACPPHPTASSPSHLQRSKPAGEE